MRRFFLGMAIASLTAGAPLTAFGGDREIADAIISTVKQTQISLKGLEVDLTVKDGNVVISGTAASQAQLDRVLTAARDTDGVKSVDNQAKVTVAETTAAETKVVPASSDVIPASASEPPALLSETTTDVEEESNADAAITSDLLGKLGTAQKAGQLKNFDLDVSTVNGDVWVRGYVATAQQKAMVLGTAQRTPGVQRVIDEVSVTGVRQASTAVVPQQPQQLQQPQQSAMPTVGGGVPRPFAPSNLANAQVGVVEGAIGGVVGGVQAPQAPVPMQGGPTYGGGVPRYDQPYMPNYAWPSYAAYPNSAAVTYPKQYSASAWPYIGPFYPYPQVPLGWRRVSLEWDDGLWYLDFTHK